MGNCGSNPKTDEGPVPIAEPVTKEIKVEQKEEEKVETKTEEKETTLVSDDKSLDTLLNQNVEEAQKTKEVKTEVDEIKTEENPKTEEAKKNAA
ncbi:hypothetical protein Lal_00021255 [Lupinus albus]|uniref:Uncharacterized protein n=1 Tax=Lupinus albus TaxID=3870 RepID=A0A6A4QB18_LUPAL|nr:hypothetical protein Lalb_Chr07g0189351 [Lupinus albus]KAF1876541.1 hypothetical protein Lal_00021255 [Lupinus albus]